MIGRKIYQDREGTTLLGNDHTTELKLESKKSDTDVTPISFVTMMSKSKKVRQRQKNKNKMMLIMIMKKHDEEIKVKRLKATEENRGGVCGKLL